MAQERGPVGPYDARFDSTRDLVVPGFETPTDGPSARDRLLVALRDSGLSYRAMAQSLNLTSPSGLRVSVARARKKLRAVGVQFQIACDRMDQEIVPLAVERMAGMVQAGVPEAVFRTLSGRGVLRDHRDSGQQAPAAMPQLQVVFQQVSNSPTIAVGAIVGAPQAPLTLPARAEVPVPVIRGDG
jgi:hypothetical protein